MDIVKELLSFDDHGASDEHPAKGITIGHIRRWFDYLDSRTIICCTLEQDRCEICGKIPGQAGSRKPTLTIVP
jgi:hypothetical protein